MNETMPEVEGLNKLISALHRLDGVLINKGKQNYQERIHRIAKSIRSMTAHAYCVVSDFSLDDKPKGLESLMDYDYLQNKLISENNIDDLDISEEKDETEVDFNMDLEDLIEYIEGELENKDKKGKKEDENEDSSSEEEKDKKDKKSSLEGNETDDNSGITKDELKEHKQFQKRFFGIEKKFRAYLKKQIQNQMLDKDNFQTFINQQRLKTPLTKSNKPNPSFIKNFFEEAKEEMEIIKKKRISMCQDHFIIKNNKPMFSSVNYNKTGGIQPNTEKIKDFKNNTNNNVNLNNNENNNKKISSFGLDDEDSKKKTDLTGFNEETIYFKCPYSYDNTGDYIDEDPEDILLKKDKDDIISENSDEDKSDNDEEDKDDEYEEIEVEEEVEVDEEVEEDDDDKKK